MLYSSFNSKLTLLKTLKLYKKKLKKQKILSKILIFIS